jgi:hypothetical protein
VIKRIALLAILGLFPLALFLLWPKVRGQFTTAEVAVAAVQQPREEVLILGSIKSPGTAPFSLQTLLIEEPGKEPYRRLVSLDAENAFELTLGKPVLGTYRASLLRGKNESSASKPEMWLATPQIRLDAARASSTESVRAREYDRPRLSIAAGVCAAVWAALFVVCLKTWRAGVQNTP